MRRALIALVILATAGGYVAWSRRVVYHHVDPTVFPLARGVSRIATYDDPPVDVSVDHDYERWLVVQGPAHTSLPALVALERKALIRTGWRLEDPAGRHDLRGLSGLSHDGVRVVATPISFRLARDRAEASKEGLPFYLEPALKRASSRGAPSLIVRLDP